MSTDFTERKKEIQAIEQMNEYSTPLVKKLNNSIMQFFLPKQQRLKIIPPYTDIHIYTEFSCGVFSAALTEHGTFLPLLLYHYLLPGGSATAS